MLLLVFVLFYFVCFCVGLFCFCFFFFVCLCFFFFFFFSSRRRHTRFDCDWSSDVCSSDLEIPALNLIRIANCRQSCSATFRALSFAVTLTGVRVPGSTASA